MFSSYRVPGKLQLPTPMALGLALGLSCVAVFAGPPESAPGAAVAAQHRVFPSVSLPERVYGEQAVAALGGRLPEVAAWYGMSTPEFARMLREDSSAWIDQRGRLFYIEQFPEATDPVNPTDPLQPALFPLDQTFSLNSRPGSKRVIYLDFDGHTTTGTAWNASYGSLITSPAYTTDADPAFSTSELQNIQNMWKQVAEDYAPFDVNITTQDPGLAAITRSGTGDDIYGTRVVITKDNFAACGCGGFAYLTAFNDTDDYYKPAFVFNTGVVGAGEAISHEVGHNLGLNHDGVTGGASYYAGHGSGATGWAPIMGVGYYQLLVQWSKGEYPGANNTEDDTAKIPTYGATLMVDDHSDTTTGASALGTVANGATTNLSGVGNISTRADVDVFSFVSGAGSYTLAVSPAPYSPNLDIRAQLYNSAGALIASSNPVDSLPASLNGSLAAGTYYVAVEGIGKGDLSTGYSDYGSLGRYTVSGTVPGSASLVPPVAVATAPGYAPGIAPLYVAFYGSGSTDSDGTIVGYQWNFGDGSSASGADVNHQYQAPGTYTATLTVTDNSGLAANTSLSISVLNQAPIAVANADKTSGTAPLAINFSSSGSYDPDTSGSIVAYAWNFGDGSSANGATASHTYPVAGNFTATLTVTDNLGATGTKTIAVSIAAPPVIIQHATGEVLGAGTLSGTYVATQTLDNFEESIREVLSSGSKSNYSYLENTWQFSVQPGTAVTLSITGHHSATSDRERMNFFYSLDGVSFTQVPITLSASSGTYSAPLPATGGTVRIRVRDSNRSPGKIILDTVYINEMYIRTEK